MPYRNPASQFVFAAFLCAGLLGTSVIARAQEQPRTHTRDANAATVQLEKEVYHQLVTQPFYTIFDDLQFQVTGSTVTLMGQVTQPTLKHDAESAVKDIEGVTQVINNIQVLPELPMDVGIRRAVYRAIYGFEGMERYAQGSLPSIHIIVNGGHVTLVGTVDNEMDKQIAETRAKSVGSVFSVDNQLKVNHRG
jgi:hyperosmotically inducible periplasmic protein